MTRNNRLRSSSTPLLALVLVVAIAACDGAELVREPFIAHDAGVLLLDAAFLIDTGVLGQDGGVLDSGVATDAGQPTDASITPDGGFGDAGSLDTGVTPDAGQVLPDSGACDPTDRGDPEKERVLLLGHSFGAVAGTDGTEIRSRVDVLRVPAQGPTLRRDDQVVTKSGGISGAGSPGAQTGPCSKSGDRRGNGGPNRYGTSFAYARWCVLRRRPTCPGTLAEVFFIR